jgi:RNA polymerase sigma-70 factor (ECF subfamily)
VDGDSDLVARLRAGDESAFADLVRMYQPRLLRLAEATLGRRDVAEEACQDTWLAVVRGVDRFEGRSSFKTWLFHILVNRARTNAGRERRAGRSAEADDIDRFDASGAWSDPPTPWSDRVDDRMAAEQLADRVHQLLPSLPDQQRTVVILRDVEGLEPAEVASLLGVSDGNQRVLLHRGRTKLRSLLAAEMGSDR